MDIGKLEYTGKLQKPSPQRVERTQSQRLPAKNTKFTQRTIGSAWAGLVIPSHTLRFKRLRALYGISLVPRGLKVFGCSDQGRLSRKTEDNRLARG
jgi:hypothetical protein